MAKPGVDYKRMEAALANTIASLAHIRINDITRIKVEKHVKSAGFGDVYIGTLEDPQNRSSTVVAIKQFRPNGTREKCLRVVTALGRELKVWADVKHPHVLPPLGFFLDDENFSKAWILTVWQVYGDLSHFLEQEKPRQKERLQLATDVAEALAYLHTLEPPIAHADIKPGNALVNSHRRVLLCDFGLSRTMTDESSGLTTTSIGMTFCYASPEQIKSNGRGTLAGDVWSWGCLFMETVTDQLPYRDSPTDVLAMVAIIQGNLPSDVEALNTPSWVKELLMECWKPETDRPSMVECQSFLVALTRKAGSAESGHFEEKHEDVAPKQVGDVRHSRSSVAIAFDRTAIFRDEDFRSENLHITGTSSASDVGSFVYDMVDEDESLRAAPHVERAAYRATPPGAPRIRTSRHTILTLDERTKVKTACPKETYNIFAATACRIYYAYPDPSSWSYAGQEGAIALVFDRLQSSFYFRMIDLKGIRGVIWQFELCDGFVYNQDRPFFHSFAGDECMIAFVFADEVDAGVFYKKCEGRLTYSPIIVQGFQAQVKSREEYDQRPDTFPPP